MRSKSPKPALRRSYSKINFMADFKTVKEFLWNDFTNVYKWEDGRMQYNSMDTDLVTDKGILYYASPLLSFGDYDNSCAVERSNVRVFMEEFGQDPYVMRKRGDYSSEIIYIDIMCDNEEIISTLCALADYPAMDDQDVSAMEMEMEEEDWSSWMKRDFKKRIEKKFGVWDSDPDDGKLFELYRELKEQTNTYYEVQSGGSGWCDLDRLLEAIETTPNFFNAEFLEE